MLGSVESVRHVDYAAGEKIFSVGQEADHAYLLETGLVQVTIGEGNQQRVLGFVGQGDVLGEMAVLDGGYRMADAYAVDDTRLAVIEQHQLQDRLNNADPLIKMMLSLISQRYRSGLANYINESPKSFEPEANKGEALSTLRLELELRKDMANGLVEVAMQPIVNLHSGETEGHEALVRWNSPVFSHLGPQALVAIAEQTRLINELGDYVFRNACQQFVALGFSSSSWLSVNVSAKQLQQQDYLERVTQLVADTGIAFSQLVFEVTESCIPEPSLIAGVLSELRALGARVALDDYGTGTSSLFHVCNLPVDIIKIDRGLIMAMTKSDSAKAITKAVLGAANALQLHVIAEGVESAADVEFLEQNGCSYVQGYYYSQALSFAELKDKYVK